MMTLQKAIYTHSAKNVLSWVFCFLFCSYLLDIQAQTINIAGPNAICSGSSATLDAGTGYVSYSWSTGATTQRITITQGGTYSVTATQVGGGQAIGLLTVAENRVPTPTIVSPNFVCTGRAIVLDAGGGYESYIWSNGLQGQTIDVSQGGTYDVTVTDFNGCRGSASTTITQETTPTPNFVRNQAICVGDTLRLDATISNAISYLWDDQSTSPIRIVSDSGMYNVLISNGRCLSYDTVWVSTIPRLTLNLGNDTLICTNGTATLNAYNPNARNYRWSNGDTTARISVNQNGRYVATISRGARCTVSDTVEVIYYNAQQGVMLDTIICGDSSFVINPRYRGTKTYVWENGATTDTLRVRQDGLYQLVVSNGTCFASLFYDIKFRKIPSVNLGKDTAFCIETDQKYYLKADIPNAESYLWHDGSTASSFLVRNNGWQHVTVTNTCGATTDSIYIGFKGCYSIFVPNAFTPNRDGVNDELQIFPNLTEVESILVFRIFDRGGSMVFEANNFEASGAEIRTWNGTAAGKIAPVGTYAYMLQFKHKNGTITMQTGDINLLK